jgi:glycosyltransferase involved in cell wall biosynthesis
MRFSIITAVFNNLEQLKGAIASVENQSNVQVEHVIQDGMSSDGTADYIESLNSSVISFSSEKDNGIYDALNRGIARANGEIIGLLHSDDFFNGDVLHKIEKFFLEGYDGVYADLDYVSKDDISKIFRKWKSGSFNLMKLRFGWMPPHPTLFLRKQVYDELGTFDLKYRIASDYDFILRVFSNPKYRIAYLPETIVKMRVGGESNKSLKNIIKKSSEDLDIASKHFSPASLTILSKNLRKVHQFI